MNARSLLLTVAACALTQVSCSTIRSWLAASRGTASASSLKIARALGIVQDVSSMPLPDAPAEYKHALTLLQQQKFDEALAELDEFQRREPTSHYAQVANWQAGRALEELARWTEAGERYRSVSLACEGIAPKLQAMALYRMSFTSEALGDDAATVAILHDLLGRASSLPDEVANAELPARIAAAYARVGNFDEAMAYYKKAEAGIAKLRRSSAGGAPPEWLPRTLYYMGSMSLRRASWSDFETALRPLSRGQAYLLQSAELGIEPWSGRAAQDLITTYRELWNTIMTAPHPDASDPLVSTRRVQRRQWDRAGLVLENVQELRARFLPDAEKTSLSEPAKNIAAFSTGLEKEIGKLLAQRPVGEGPTPESVARKAALRGSVIAPDGSLERQYNKGARATLPATHLPDKTEAPESPKEDPNL